MAPLVSVVIPFYNEECYIGTSLRNILDQTYGNLEVVLVDDGSTDGSLATVRGFKDSRIRVVSNERNLGRPAAKNLGINKATGEFVAIMDADDECDPTRIEKQLGLVLEGGPATVSGTWFRVVVDGGERVKELPVDHAGIARGFTRRFDRVTFHAATILCASRVLRRFGYREKFKYFSDWDLLLRMHESGTVVFRNVPEALCSYCIRDKSTRHQRDWYDYNLFARDCQDRRRTGGREFDSVEEFRSSMRGNRPARIRYGVLEFLIRMRRRIVSF